MERINRGDYIALVGSLLGKGEAVVLTGHKRAGKSCLLELLAAELSHKGNVIYIDMENPENADLTTFRELSERIKEAVVEGRRNYVLIDESCSKYEKFVESEAGQYILSTYTVEVGRSGNFVLLTK